MEITGATPATPGDRRCASAVLARATAPAHSPLPMPRLLVVLAHPDDEVLALGGRLERLANSRLLTVTDGAPLDGVDARDHGFGSLEDYRAARRAELNAALAQAGLAAEIAAPIAGTSPLPLPDQTAALHLRELARAVAAAIHSFAPEAVLTHPYEGGHPDHDACAFAVHTALHFIAGHQRSTEGPASPLPIVIEAPFYHAGPSGSICTGEFLSMPGELQTATHELSPREQANKRARLACFRSQGATLAQFGVGREVFRIAPQYDFTRPPHESPLFFESFPWGMTGDRFRALAAAALAEIFGEFVPLPLAREAQRSFLGVETPTRTS